MRLDECILMLFIPVNGCGIGGGGGGGGTAHVAAKLDRLAFANSDADGLCVPFSLLKLLSCNGWSLFFSRWAGVGELALAVTLGFIAGGDPLSVDCT